MTETPQNGIKGLKHWRYDLLAGLQVALVSLPLSIGIAIASGAPAVTGLISAIIAGLIFPFLGGAFVTISGPAAGLAPALLAGMLMLGGGDLAEGYPLLLVAICLTGLLQILLAFFKTGRYAIFLPVTVVEAMLAAIGLIIIIKQIPTLMGAILPAAGTMLASVTKLPQALLQIDWAVFFIGAISLFLMFYLNKSRYEWMRKIPPALVVTILGILLAALFSLEAKYLITMPDKVLDGITMPAFGEVLSRPELWWGVLMVVITLTLIDGVESLATIKAVDKIDPFQRKSDPNVTLRSMGISNTLSSIFGGLTIIPGGIKSRTNIDAGGRTLWANFYNAMFLLIFLFVAAEVIAMVPLAAIAAILIYVGWKLCEYKVFTKTYAIGRDQLIIFIITVIAILGTDLLVGILVGIAAEVLILLYLLTPSFRYVLTGRLSFKRACCLLWDNLRVMFKTPILKIKELEKEGIPHYEITLSSLVCFNLLPLDKILASLPPKEGVTLIITESGRIIDHTAIEYLHQFEEKCVRDGRLFELVGVENFVKFTEHALAARMQDTALAKEQVERTEREKEMERLAKQYSLSFQPAEASILNEQDFVYLRRGADKQESNIMLGEFSGCTVRLFDYSHTAAPNYYTKYWNTIITSRCLIALSEEIPDMVITPGHYLEPYLVEYDEIELPYDEGFTDQYRCFGKEGNDPLSFISPELIEFLKKHDGFYLEIRKGVMLAFRKVKGLENTDDISLLFSLVKIFNDSCANNKLGNG
ncbi:MAG: SulP family inorganic anion transporter [Gammaproteobacteria bacterium]|nr:SulP family inorganic anion transporter [Gammaproteobacteria bacterium]